jgi:hypothetical protein
VNKGYEIIGAEFKKNLTIQLSPVFFFVLLFQQEQKGQKNLKIRKKNNGVFLGIPDKVN